MPTAHGTPDEGDEPVGAALARMRRAKQFTGAHLAALVGMSQPKISRIERGKGLPDPGDVGVIARALGADEEQVQALMERAERSHDRMTDWRSTMAGFAGQQTTLGDWEAAAEVMHVFEPALVPGPLQTSGYAQAVISEFRRIVQPDEDALSESSLLAAVSARIRRQEVLADRSKSFQFLVGEAALKHRVFSPVEMLAQIDHLRGLLTRNDHVKIAVIPDGAPSGMPLLHGFTLLDDRIVVVDLYNTGLISRSPAHIDSYHRVFAALAEHATDISPFLDSYRAAYIGMLQDTPRG